MATTQGADQGFNRYLTDIHVQEQFFVVSASIKCTQFNVLFSELSTIVSLLT